jgi:hypothetical protein
MKCLNDLTVPYVIIVIPLNREDDLLLYAMNIYDKKSVRCSNCDRFIGEIDYDAVVTLPKCGRCANPLPEGDDKVQYIVSKFNKNPKDLVTQA